MIIWQSNLSLRIKEKFRVKNRDVERRKVFKRANCGTEFAHFCGKSEKNCDADNSTWLVHADSLEIVVREDECFHLYSLISWFVVHGLFRFTQAMTFLVFYSSLKALCAPYVRLWACDLCTAGIEIKASWKLSGRVIQLYVYICMVWSGVRVQWLEQEARQCSTHVLQIDTLSNIV